ncbi:serine/threonine-protein kinase pim-2-like [Danio aesculapii]|uniref:serine/threonine-protein kinase pim-2-like n=1 Tax=Danio aesculapii TaxID=1142201 RepID=UPI0024C0B36A|nr:serine/threonine-protein kinase pim-2-like [Danio aesculapii]
MGCTAYMNMLSTVAAALFMEMFLFVFFILEKPKKGRKGKRVSAFFKRVWKAAKRHFLCCDTDIVQYLTPQPEPEPEPESEPEPELEDKADSEAVSVEVTPENAEPADPESVCLPGQVPEEPKKASGLTFGSVVALFEVKDLIGEGSFGKVYLASHVFNERSKVALKWIKKRKQDRYLDIDGHSTPVLAEVAMMLRLMNAPSCPSIITLHHWIENEDDFVLILEYPQSCQNLAHYVRRTLDIDENQARRLMRQLVQAVKFCAERGVFHGDIHPGNILVTQPRLELKLIDFGCARPITSEPFKSSDYRGAIFYRPPEVLRDPTFFPNPAYVWTLGIILYEILHGQLAFRTTHSIIIGDLETDLTLSSECLDLISQCLIRNPEKRLQLHQVEEHRWFNPTSPNPVQQLDKRR